MKAKKLNKRQKDLYAVCRRHRINYHQLSNDMKSVRVALEAEPFYQKPKRSHKIDTTPSTDTIKTFFKAFDKKSSRTPWMLYKTLAGLIFDTGVRNDEARMILVSEIDFEDRTILIHGKGTNNSGKRDRSVSISPHIAEILKVYLASHPNNIWLFQNNKNTKCQPYSTRRFQQIFKAARETGNINFRLTPHTGRHTAITEFTKAGIANPAIMLQSGHESEAGLARYQHLKINQFQAEFDTVRQLFWAGVM